MSAEPASDRPGDPSAEPLFAPPSADTSHADDLADLDSNYDMLDDEDDQGDDGPAAAAATSHAGPGPNTLAHRERSKKRPADSPPNLPQPPKKQKPRTATQSSPAVPRAGSAGGGGGGAGRIPPLPHFTVVRSADNSKTSPHRICILQGVTDADPGKWPSQAECQPDRKVAGQPNWYERVPKEVGRHKNFRDKVGEELAKSLKLVQRSNEYWTLDALPDNYLFTVHHCMGGGKPRTDVYVWGCPKVLKFRTANEMTPHIYWLLIHGPNDSIACQCKYCAKTTQSDVNRQLGLPTKEPSAGSPAAAGSSVSGPRVKNPVNYAYRPSPLALGSGGGGSGPSSAASSLYGGAGARVASFNDPGGDRLLGPNATPAAIAKAKRRHAREMDDLAGLGKIKKKKKNKLDQKGKGKEVDGKKKKKKRRHGVADESTDASRIGESSNELSDLSDTTISDSSESDADTDDVEGSGPTYRGAFTNRQRDEDLERPSAPRRGELVWAALPRPLVGQRGPLAGKVVTHWPGIVESREVRAEATVVGPPPVPAGVGAGAEYEEPDEDARARGSSSADGTLRTAAGTTLRMPPAPRLETVTSTRYTVRLFAVADTLRLLREDQVLPWLHHAPPKSLFADFGTVLQDAEAVKHIWDGSRGAFVRDAVLFDDDRAEEEANSEHATTTLDEALAPLGLAMQIASHVLTSFTLNDRYNVTARFLTPVDPLDPVHRQEREKQLKSWAFQATHFGAELVWTGDFIRIFEADGTPFEALRYESPPTSMGKRALFMKVFAIYKDNEVGSEIGVIKLAGELWELRDFATTTTTATAAAAAAAAGQEADADPNTANAAAAISTNPLEAITNSIGAADGQSAMSMFEKRPSPAGLNGSAAHHQVAGTPSTPPDTPPAGANASTAGGTAAAPKAVAAGQAVSDPDGLNLPPPPAGFYWFRLTSSTEQVHVTLDFLAGRYHPLPRELNSPAKIRDVLDRLEQSDSDELTDDDARAVLLAGLGPAYELFNKCGIYIGDRKTALVAATQHAESEARPILEEGAAAAAAALAAATLLQEDPPAPNATASAA
ncbi:hypothetical protein JCM3774_005107 [Rhodotorula dairenensis]